MALANTCPAVSHATAIASGPRARVVVEIGQALISHRSISSSVNVAPWSSEVNRRWPRRMFSPAPRYDAYTAPPSSVIACSPQQSQAPSCSPLTGRAAEKVWPSSRETVMKTERSASGGAPVCQNTYRFPSRSAAMDGPASTPSPAAMANCGSNPVPSSVVRV